MINRIFKIPILFFSFLLLAQTAYAQIEMPEWPAELEVRGQKVVIYQPQTESYSGEKLEARAAFSAEVNKKPIFGAMWFSCRVATDKDNRLVAFDQLKVDDVKFPEEDQGKLDTFVNDLNEIFQDIVLTMSLDQFLADQQETTDRKAIDSEFNNQAPKVYFETSPAVLVLIDGDPILKELDNSSYKYVVNTPFFMLSDTRAGTNYLKGGKWWYSSNELTSGWKSIENPPSEVNEIADQAFTEVEDETDSASMELTSPPQVIVSTKPAELIQSDGEPKFGAIKGTNLLLIENSENDILMDISSQEYYVLISGRWYKSGSMESGSWTFVRSDQLPDGFKDIPEDSDAGNVRANIAGTQESKDAILENSIPQTAEVDRKTATVEVKYDGNPKFEKIEGTSFLYAANADKTVLKDNSKYYCVDNGIWFESSQATGPWQVSVSVPEGVQDIPPSSPVYNVKYVYIYDHTPDVVYVGYTPGYYWSFPYYGSVIYGTGYYYRPWYGSYYYPRPVTYGFGVHYNPWTGWGFSYGVSFGWMSFSFHSGGYSGWWGPGGYRYGYRHGYYHGYGHGYRQGYWQGRADQARRNRATTMPNRRPGTAASNNRARPQARPANAYRDRSTGVKSTGVRPSTRPVQRPTASTRPAGTTRPEVSRPGSTTRPANRPNTGNTRPATRPNTGNTRPVTRPNTGNTRPATDASRVNRNNNVYSDRNGNIYRQNQSGNWQQRSGGSWQNSNRSVPNSVNRSHQNRSYGQQRANSYSRSAPAAGRARAGAGMRRR